MDFLNALGMSAKMTAFVAILIIVFIVLYWILLYVNIGRIIDNQKYKTNQIDKLIAEQKKTNTYLKKLAEKDQTTQKD